MAEVFTLLTTEVSSDHDLDQFLTSLGGQRTSAENWSVERGDSSVWLASSEQALEELFEGDRGASIERLGSRPKTCVVAESTSTDGTPALCRFVALAFLNRWSGVANDTEPLTASEVAALPDGAFPRSFEIDFDNL